jgi:(2Fe-2S) ferredoxin
MGKKKLDSKAKKLQLGKLRAHVLVCSAGKCAGKAEAERAVKKFKQRLSSRKLTARSGGVMCTSMDCLHICAGGPIAVVWPDGVWYRDATAENLDRILEQHILGGKVVKELRIAGPKRVKVA